MSRFTIHTIDSAPADSRAALEALLHEVGFLPNLAATMAASPTPHRGLYNLDAGFTPAQALGVIAVVAFTTIANYAHNLTGCAIDPPFQPQVWTSPASNRRSA